MDYHAVRNFAERNITLKFHCERFKVGFIGISETTDKLGGIEESSSKNQFRSFGFVSNFPHKLLSLTTDPHQRPTDPTVTVSEDELFKNEKGGTNVRIRSSELK